MAFKSKLDTDLFEFAKNKTRPLNLTVSPGGKFLAAFSADKKVFILSRVSNDHGHDHNLEVEFLV